MAYRRRTLRQPEQTPRHDANRGHAPGAAFQSFGRPVSPIGRALIIGAVVVGLFILACIGAAVRAG